jgi:hypothetical protein
LPLLLPEGRDVFNFVLTPSTGNDNTAVVTNADKWFESRPSALQPLNWKDQLSSLMMMLQKPYRFVKKRFIVAAVPCVSYWYECAKIPLTETFKQVD